MLKEKNKHIDVAIVIARFQVHTLTEAHKELIETVKNNHDKVIIFLGLSPLRNTFTNPLDYRTRKAMLQEHYPDIDVYYIDDVPSDELWSKNLDSQINKWINPSQSVILYGSRDSFISHYKGKFPTCELESRAYISGTELRRQVCNNYPPNKDYRAGLIAATANRYPIAYQTVDIAIVTEDYKLILGRKSIETKWRFIGGFSDVNTYSLEQDVMREAKEEANIEVGDIRYIGSILQNDWRYEHEKDKIKTALFYAKYVFGKPEGGDDIAEVSLFEIDKIKKDIIVDTHKPIFDMFIKWWDKTKWEFMNTKLVKEISNEFKTK